MNSELITKAKLLKGREEFKKGIWGLKKCLLSRGISAGT
jgi:hypothetical protein